MKKCRQESLDSEVVITDKRTGIKTDHRHVPKLSITCPKARYHQTLIFLFFDLFFKFQVNRKKGLILKSDYELFKGTTLVYAIGAGITAAAGITCPPMEFVKVFRLYSFISVSKQTQIDMNTQKKKKQNIQPRLRPPICSEFGNW